MTELAERLLSANKIMIVHVGALGDTLHQIPAAYLIHRANPAAEIHFMAGGGCVELFSLFPWITKVRIAPHRLGPKAWPELLRLRTGLVPLKFDVALTFWPRNSFTPLLWISGAPYRAARSAQAGKDFSSARLLCHELLDYPWFIAPWSVENCRALGNAGLPMLPGFDYGAEIPADLRRVKGIDAAQDFAYLHVSPFSTSDRRDPPIADLAALLNGVNARCQLPMAISVSGDQRQLGKLDELLAMLDFRPWKVFAGELNLMQFISVVAGCALHLGPDSGGIHVAVMAQRPVLAWFRNSSAREARNLLHFSPPTSLGKTFTSTCADEDALRGLPLDAMIEQTVSALSSAHPPNRSGS